METQFKNTIDVDYIMHMGSDEMIAHAAWVSTQGRKEKTPEEVQEKMPGLLNYLMKHRHGTPFEHGALTVRVHAPIFVWREWHRHRIGFSYNEESARYKQLDPVFYLPEKSRPMFKVDDWAPGKPKFRTIEDEGAIRFENATSDPGTYHSPHDDFEALINMLMANSHDAYRRYEHALQRGFDPGLARDVLPVNIFSACYVTCNPRSLMAFLSLRTHEADAKFVSYPLYEIDMAARKLEEIFKQYWPIAYKAFCENGRVAP